MNLLKQPINLYRSDAAQIQIVIMHHTTQVEEGKERDGITSLTMRMVGSSEITAIWLPSPLKLIHLISDLQHKHSRMVIKCNISNQSCIILIQVVPTRIKKH